MHVFVHITIIYIYIYIVGSLHICTENLYTHYIRTYLHKYVSICRCTTFFSIYIYTLFGFFFFTWL